MNAAADGQIKYKNTFILRWGELSFAEKDGVAYLVRDGEYHRLSVEDHRILIEDLDFNFEGNWGGSKWNYGLE